MINPVKKLLLAPALTLVIGFQLTAGVVLSSIPVSVPMVATVAVVVAVGTQTACSKDQLAASAADVLSVLTDSTLIKALQTLSPPLLAKIETLVPTAKDLITAIKNGDTSTALAAVNTIFPVIEEAFALFSGGNPAVLAVLALANIALHFIINHVKTTKTARAARAAGVHSVTVALDYEAQPTWGCNIRKDKRCEALAH